MNFDSQDASFFNQYKEATMFFTEKIRNFLFNTGIIKERISKLESRIKFLEKRNRDNENVIYHLINLTKKESFKDENQQELNLRQKL